MKRAASNKVQQLASWIRDMEFAMLTTEDRTGQLRSRPMVVLEQMPDDAIWFFSEASCQKVDDVQGHHSVNVRYTDATGKKFVSVSGRARVVRDREQMRSLWCNRLNEWFPKGAEDPELVLLRIEVHEAELWQAPEREFEVKIEAGNPARSTHETLSFA